MEAKMTTAPRKNIFFGEAAGELSENVAILTIWRR
jgi:hypothetical protein